MEESPLKSLPVFYIHSFETPFCNDPSCTCQLHKKEITQLFVRIVEGKFELEKANQFTERKAQ